ncbi:hypothetical protein Tco_1206474 [Tanacetum coccineum]
MREVHRVQVFDFRGLPDLMAKGLSGSMLMEYRDAQGQILVRRSYVSHELEAVYFSLGTTYSRGVRDCWIRCILGQEFEVDPRQGGSECLLDRDFICWRFSSIAGRSQAPEKVLEFVCFGEEAWGYDIGGDLPVIDMTELVRLQIYIEIDDTWAWVAPGPERQPNATAGAYKAIEDALAVNEGAQAVPEPI